MQLLEGHVVSQAVKNDLRRITLERKEARRKIPHLAAVLIGSNGASESYVSSKVKACEEIGFASTLLRLTESISKAELFDVIHKLNADPDVDGILVQLPLPPHIKDEEVINRIDPTKDVDGFHPINAGRMVQGLSTFLPATPYGIMLLLDHYRIHTSGMNAVVIGRSNIVGRPISILLSNNSPQGNCTVTICHSHTKNLEGICRNADILVAAMGRPGFVKSEMVKTGAIVIDVGITRVNDQSKKRGYSIKGDVDFDAVASKCSFITPVPGGVGPMTIAALMKNTLLACKMRSGD